MWIQRDARQRTDVAVLGTLRVVCVVEEYGRGERKTTVFPLKADVKDNRSTCNISNFIPDPEEGFCPPVIEPPLDPGSFRCKSVKDCACRLQAL